MKDQAQSSPSCEIYESLFFSYACLKIINSIKQSCLNNQPCIATPNIFLKPYQLKWQASQSCPLQIIPNYIIEQGVGMMLSSFSKHLSDSRHYTVTLDRVLNYLSILVIDQLNDMILTCRLTPDDCPVTLLQIFDGKMEILYAYLERDDSQMEIMQDMEVICIWYSLVVLKKTVNKQIRMPTKKYLLAKDSAFYPTNSHSQEKMNMSDSFDHAENIISAEQLWKSHLARFNDQQTLSKFHCLKSPDWFVNNHPQLLLQLGGKIPMMVDKQGRSRYQVSIQVGQFPNEVEPRYDLTFGIAHHSRLAQMKQGYKGNLDDQISISVKGRIVTWQCYQLIQNKTSDKVVQLNRLRIELIEVHQQQNTRLESISFVIDQKLINLISEQTLSSMNRLTNLQEYFPFVYFYRSFLHFSFDLQSYNR